MAQESQETQHNSVPLQNIVEQRLLSFIESAGDAMLLLDEEGEIILTNNLVHLKSGYTVQELIGEHIEVLIPVLSSGDKLDGSMSQFAPHRSLGMNKDLKMFVSRKDGVEFPAKITFSSMDIHDEIYTHVTIQASLDDDIVEQRVLQSERMLRETQRIAKIASWEWDAVTREFYYSDNFYNIAQVGPSLAINRYEDFLDLVHEDDREYVKKAFGRALNGKGHYNVQYRFVTADNNVVDVYDEGLVDFDTEGNPIRMIGFMQDITDRRTAESALKRYAAELQEANDLANAALEAKSKFLAIMSHELRTPLNGVIGMASLLDGTELNDEQKDYVETIFNSGDSLLSIINDILDYTKLDTGKLEVSVRPFDLRDCVNELMATLYPVAQNKGLELLCYIDIAVPQMILGDKSRIKQVLMNLMSNAIKFTNAGVVEIKVQIADQTQYGYKLNFSVHDTGIGIPEHKLHVLFELFQQVDDSNSRQFGGTGLGLAICKRLVHLMNGDLGVSSSDEGSTFWFDLHTPNIEMKGRSRVASFFQQKRTSLICTNERTGNRIHTWLNSLGMRNKVYAGLESFIEATSPDIKPEVIFVDLEGLEEEHTLLEEFARINNMDTELVYLLPSVPASNKLSGNGLMVPRPLNFDVVYNMLYNKMCDNVRAKKTGQ